MSCHGFSSSLTKLSATPCKAMGCREVVLHETPKEHRKSTLPLKGFPFNSFKKNKFENNHHPVFYQLLGGGGHFHCSKNRSLTHSLELSHSLFSRKANQSPLRVDNSEYLTTNVRKKSKNLRCLRRQVTFMGFFFC